MGRIKTGAGSNGRAFCPSVFVESRFLPGYSVFYPVFHKNGKVAQHSSLAQYGPKCLLSYAMYE